MNGEWERGEPRVVGGYELVSLLGKGGMAKVHLARKVGEDGYVAVKAVRADDLDDEAGTVTLHDEARLLSHIRHPNVVPLLDVLRAEDQILLVMPFVRGASLAELMVGHSRAQTMIPAGVASAIAQDILAGPGSGGVAAGGERLYLEGVALFGELSLREALAMRAHGLERREPVTPGQGHPALLDEPTFLVEERGGARGGTRRTRSLGRHGGGGPGSAVAAQPSRGVGARTAPAYRSVRGGARVGE